MTAVKNTFVLLVVLFCGLCCLAEQGRHQFILETAYTILPASPVSIDLDGIGYNTDSREIALYRLDDGKKTALSCQLEASSGKVWFMPGRRINVGEKIAFEIAFEDAVKKENLIKADTGAETITLVSGGKNILSYHYGLCDVPDGVDEIYRKNGFIHPLFSPAGKVLTCIQPKDHYHHYGIWGPWTKTKIDGREVNFWDMAAGQGTVRFGGFLSKVSGPVFGGFKARQEHWDLSDKAKSKTAINEVLDVKAFAGKVDNKDIWIIDLMTVFNNALESPIEFEQYRYGGGIGFRATQKWTKDNCSALTSAGKTRKDADSTRARWCDVNGDAGKDEYCGIVFLSHIANREHPEPMMVWSADANGGRGDMFFEFCPIKFKNWIIKPGKEYVLRYRMIVYDGKLNPETMETLWKNYVYPPTVTSK